METKLINHVPLNGTNYAIWKKQCKMTLIRERVLWNIVNETEVVPEPKTDTNLYTKYLSWKDPTSVMIVSSVEPSCFD